MSPDWAAKPTTVPYAKFGDPQSLNLYSYVDNGPVNRIDADGHGFVNEAFQDWDFDIRQVGVAMEEANSQSSAAPPKAAAPEKPTVTATATGTTATITRTYDYFDGDAVVEYGEVETRTGNHPFRDNNPGDIVGGTFSKANGAVGTDGRFAIFPNAATGFQALTNLLMTSTYQNLSIDAAIVRYAPPIENDTKAYQAGVAAAVGAPGQTRLSNLSASQLGNMVQAIARIEGFFQAGTVTTRAFGYQGFDW